MDITKMMEEALVKELTEAGLPDTPGTRIEYAIKMYKVHDAMAKENTKIRNCYKDLLTLYEVDFYTYR